MPEPREKIASSHCPVLRSGIALRTLIVSDIRLYRDGMCACFQERESFEVVGTAGSMEEAVRMAERRRPEVIVIDLATRRSLDGVAGLGRLVPGVAIIGFGVEEVLGEVVACAEAGLTGYVPSEAGMEELMLCVEAVCRGELVCPPRIAAGLFRSLARRGPGPTQGPEIGDLTRRERQVLQRIDSGLSNKEIARELGLEVSTVKNHVHSLLKKLKVSTRSQAAARLGTHLSTRQRAAAPSGTQRSL